ncbi:MAG TPA: hypothetical protein V6D08_19900 [Candidatus Obscuribacterales bacterium]
MTFVIDPRMCLYTGKQLAGCDQPCCGGDHSYRQQPVGLGAAISERARHNQFRMQLSEKREQSLYDRANLSMQLAYTGSPQYVRPSRSTEFLRSAQRTSTGATEELNQVLYVPPGPNRRESFAGVLRRMFGRCPV